MPATAIISSASAAAWSGRSVIDNTVAPSGNTIVLNNNIGASTDIAGLDADQVHGAVKVLINRGDDDIVLKQEDTAADASDRFATDDTTLAPGAQALLFYNGTRWEVYSAGGSSGGIAPATVDVNGTINLPPTNAYQIAGAPVVSHLAANNSYTFGVSGSSIAMHTGFGALTLLYNAGGGTLQTPANTPAQITANQNDYNIGNAYFVRLSTDASRNITGMVSGGLGTSQSEFRWIVNVGAADIVLKHQDAASAAANRLLNSTGADITLTANQAAFAIYDLATARWRVFKQN